MESAESSTISPQDDPNEGLGDDFNDRLTEDDEPDNENRPENTFAVEDGDGKNTVYIYYRQQGSGTRVFQISYCVENVVKLYSDVGEFFWNLIGEDRHFRHWHAHRHADSA